MNPTDIIDSDHPAIRAHAEKTINGSKDPVDKAVKIYYAVRDGIRYDPYCPCYLPEHYRASNILKNGRGYCVCKASLLCALGRACQIPSRIGFADVKNHLATRQLLELLGSDLFVYHGYVEFFLEDKWVKATPAFNRELCVRHNVAPLEFNGREDSIFQSFNLEHKRFMEYVAEHGVYADISVDMLVAGWKAAYGEERVLGWIEGWIKMSEKREGISGRDFSKEDVVGYEKDEDFERKPL
ncbi:MAG: transglutaminase domain-containing protein [Deltaproteobacteria bacterium]|nr:transglutaminase domain-containing protein [Deltaproteobacteria bacterium]